MKGVKIKDTITNYRRQKIVFNRFDSIFQLYCLVYVIVFDRMYNNKKYSTKVYHKCPKYI